MEVVPPNAADIYEGHNGQLKPESLTDDLRAQFTSFSAFSENHFPIFMCALLPLSSAFIYYVSMKMRAKRPKALCVTFELESTESSPDVDVVDSIRRSALESKARTAERFAASILDRSQSSRGLAISTSVLNTLDSSSSIARPVPRSEAGGNVYFITKKDAPGGVVAIFKPHVEQTTTQTNSSRRVYAIGDVHPLKNGLVAGDSIKKEVAAYMLDHGGRAGVPETIMRRMQLDDGVDVLGSLQRYVSHFSSAEDVSSSLFDTENIHAIGLLDLRLMNLDRHVGNLLVTSRSSLTTHVQPIGGTEVVEPRPFTVSSTPWYVVPIDHAYSLPHVRAMSDGWFEWTYWEQAKKPFSAETRRYVENLDPLHDARILAGLHLRPECILTNTFCTIFVKLCVAHDLMLQEIALKMQRNVCEPERESIIELLVRQACDQVLTNTSSFPSPLSQTYVDLINAFDTLATDYLTSLP